MPLLGSLAVAGLLAAGCADDDAEERDADTAVVDSDDQVGEPDVDAPDGPGGAAALPTGDLADCPAGFADAPLDAGTHEGFTSGGQDRAFHLLLPEGLPDTAEPAPLFVSLTGTVQEEASFMAQAGIDALPDDGWVVVAPVRNDNGLVWGPWDAMRTPAMTDPNPDVELVLDLVACLGAHHPIDVDRVFAGGISIGGTMVTTLLRAHPEVFAGGIVGSGNFILTEPPEPQPLDDLTVIVAWGGDDDQWSGCPDGRMGDAVADEPGCVSVDFVADALAATEFFVEEGARVLACSDDVGHIWISHATPWWAAVLAESPKGTTVALSADDAPAPLACTVE